MDPDMKNIWFSRGERFGKVKVKTVTIVNTKYI